MEDNRKVVIELQNVKRYFKVGDEIVKALRGVSFKIYEGEFVTIQGTSGSGKSTLLKLLSRVTGPTTGTIRARGRIGSLLEVGTGFHSEMTGRFRTWTILRRKKNIRII